MSHLKRRRITSSEYEWLHKGTVYVYPTINSGIMRTRTHDMSTHDCADLSRCFTEETNNINQDDEWWNTPVHERKTWN